MINFGIQEWIILCQENAFVFFFLKILIFWPTKGVKMIKKWPRMTSNGKNLNHQWLLPNKASDNHNIWYTEVTKLSLMCFKFSNNFNFATCHMYKKVKKAPKLHMCYQPYISNETSNNHKFWCKSVNLYSSEDAFSFFVNYYFCTCCGA